MSEQRKNQRIQINRSVVYIGMNYKDQVETQGVGRALDLSPKGMMIESTEPIYVDKLSIRTSNDKGDSIEVGATVIYSMPHSPGTYRTGVQFSGPAEKAAQFTAEMLKK